MYVGSPALQACDYLGRAEGARLLLPVCRTSWHLPGVVPIPEGLGHEDGLLIVIRALLLSNRSKNELAGVKEATHQCGSLGPRL